MLLILTNSDDATANYLSPILEDRHLPFLRLDTDSLTSKASIAYRLGQPKIEVDRHWYSPEDITDVWYRRPERLRDPRFADSPEGKYALDEWAEAVEGFLAHVPASRWMNHPVANAMASHKPQQLTTALSLGLQVPDTLITQDPPTVRAFFEQHNGRIVVKPMAGGYVERAVEDHDSLIYTNTVAPSHLENLDDLPACPTLFQQFIDKAFDVRITIVDADVHAVELRATDSDGSQRCDIRRDNMEGVAYRRTVLPEDVGAGLRRIVNHYALRFAAVDMVVGSDGTWYFLEVNPNGQWAWLDLSAGCDIAGSFVRSFEDRSRSG